MQNDTTMTAFDRNLENASLKSYLRASAYASGERSELEKNLTEDIYYDYFYAESNAAEEYANDIINRIYYDNARNVVLSGYKGCGKTTFIHYLARKLKTRQILLNCDEIVDYQSEIKTILVMHIYNEIASDIVDKDYVVATKFNEIFNTDTNRTIISRHFDVDNRLIYLFKKIEYAVRLRKYNHDTQGSENFLRLNVKIDISSFDINRLMILIIMWDTAKRYSFELSAKCCIIFDNLDTIYNTSSLPEFVKQIALFRNNIDRIFDQLTYLGKPLGDPTQDYYCIFVMRETTKAEFTDHFHDQKVSMYIPKTNMSYLYDIRMIIRRKREYLDTLIRKEGQRNNKRIKHLLQQINRLEGLLDDQFLHDDLLSLFNHDYRTCFEVLSEIDYTDNQFYQSCEDLKRLRHSYSWNRYGARCLIFRKIYNLFRDAGYYDLLRRGEYILAHDGKEHRVNIDRLILLFLSNSQNIHSTENLKENEFVEVSVLFKEFFKFCNDHTAIVDSIWDMYEMRKFTYWNHLVTFDEMRDVTREELKRQMICVENGENIKFAKIRITAAGRTYLDVMIPQFEYYASRVYGEMKPSLFSFGARELLIPENIVSYSRDVRYEISSCCKRLMQFFDSVFDEIPEYSGDNFLSSKLAWHKLNENVIISMYHCERVIHANIGYLDSFRKYALYRIDEFFDALVPVVHTDFTSIFRELSRRNYAEIELEDIFSKTEVVKFTVSPQTTHQTAVISCTLSNGKIVHEKIDYCKLRKYTKAVINRTIISEIIHYIKMLGLSSIRSQVTRYSENTVFLVTCYNCCINHIAQRNYFDFDTSIDRKCGELMLRKK